MVYDPSPVWIVLFHSDRAGQLPQHQADHRLRVHQQGARQGAGGLVVEAQFAGNFTEVEVPGEVTVSRSATYQQTSYVDPETGETFTAAASKSLARGLQGGENPARDPEHRRKVR